MKSFLQSCLSFLLIAFAITVSNASPAHAQLSAADQRMLNRAEPYRHLVNELIDKYWPEIPNRAYLPAQVEKESLWIPDAQLCVPKPSCSRELGLGFGQFTITPKMNVWQEVRAKHPDLRDWTWERRFDPRLQLTAMLVYNKEIYGRCRPLMSNDWGGLACTASSYNGGFGGFSADRRLCSNTIGCNPLIWTGHIELHSTKSKVRVPGYGEPFYHINRGYVKFLMLTAPNKYMDFVDEKWHD